MNTFVVCHPLLNGQLTSKLPFHWGSCFLRSQPHAGVSCHTAGACPRHGTVPLPAGTTIRGIVLSFQCLLKINKEKIAFVCLSSGISTFISFLAFVDSFSSLPNQTGVNFIYYFYHFCAFNWENHSQKFPCDIHEPTINYIIRIL